MSHGQPLAQAGSCVPPSPRPLFSSWSGITTERLVLRKARAGDRAGLVELQSDPAVRTYLGGPRPRDVVERLLDESGVARWTAEPGSFVVADRHSDRLVGTVSLQPRPRARPGHVLERGGELELSYALRRDCWGTGIAEEATRALLDAAAAELPDQPVLIVTQVANERCCAWPRDWASSRSEPSLSSTPSKPCARPDCIKHCISHDRLEHVLRGERAVP